MLFPGKYYLSETTDCHSLVCVSKGTGILSALEPRGSGEHTQHTAEHGFHGEESQSPPGDRQSEAHQQDKVSTQVGEGEQPGLLTPGVTLRTPRAHLGPGR